VSYFATVMSKTLSSKRYLCKLCVCRIFSFEETRKLEYEERFIFIYTHNIRYMG
jgi:hypothetical protein